MEKLRIYQKLAEIQQTLKAPKTRKMVDQHGKVRYTYRNTSDILDAVKPLLGNDYVLVINDAIVQLGERYYLEATCCLVDVQGGTKVETKAYARECLMRGGMDDAQLTGAASTYARKYALNALFCIDDTVDPDEYADEDNSVKKPTKAAERLLQVNAAMKKIEEKGLATPESVLEAKKKRIVAYGGNIEKIVDFLKKAGKLPTEATDLTIETADETILAFQTKAGK